MIPAIRIDPSGAYAAATPIVEIDLVPEVKIDTGSGDPIHGLDTALNPWKAIYLQEGINKTQAVTVTGNNTGAYSVVAGYPSETPADKEVSIAYEYGIIFFCNGVDTLDDSFEIAYTPIGTVVDTHPVFDSLRVGDPYDAVQKDYAGQQATALGFGNDAPGSYSFAAGVLNKSYGTATSAMNRSESFGQYSASFNNATASCSGSAAFNTGVAGHEAMGCSFDATTTPGTVYAIIPGADYTARFIHGNNCRIFDDGSATIPVPLAYQIDTPLYDVAPFGGTGNTFFILLGETVAPAPTGMVVDAEIAINAFACGSGRASGEYAHAEGQDAVATGQAAHAEGDMTTASGTASHSEGYLTTASGDYSHAGNRETIASGASSHAEGHQTTSSGLYGHAEGNGTVASGTRSHAEGYDTTASGDSSHAEGYATVAGINSASHAEGDHTTASGSSSHSEGSHTTASGNYSHAEGSSTNTNFKEYAHAEGHASLNRFTASHVSASGKIAANGDAQYERIVIFTTTADATPTKMRLNNTTELVLPASSLFRFTAEIVMVNTANGLGGAYRVTGLVGRVGAAAANLPTPAIVVTEYEDVSLAACDITVSVSGNNLEIAATGIAATTIRWVGSVHFTEVIYA